MVVVIVVVILASRSRLVKVIRFRIVCTSFCVGLFRVDLGTCVLVVQSVAAHHRAQ